MSRRQVSPSPSGHLLEPTELTLNLLRQSKVVPKISVFAHVRGHHDYMKKPFAPLGCAIEAHVKPYDHRIWDSRSDARFSLGTSMQHHRCFRVYITKTRATRISDTMYYKHQYITNPKSHLNPTRRRGSPATRNGTPSKAISRQATRRQRL